VDQKTRADDGEDHQAQGELQDQVAIAEQAFLGNVPAVEEQQRRQEQQKEHFRIELHAAAGEFGDQRAERDLHQRQRHRERQHAHQIAAGDERQQHEQHYFDRVHGVLKYGRGATRGRAQESAGSQLAVADQHYVGRAAREQSDGDDAGNLVKLALQLPADR